MDFLEQCRRIIQIPSTPSAGNAEVATFCAQLCKDAGLVVDLQEAQFLGKKQYNLIARPQKSQRKNEIIFQTHLDTVEPGPHGNWTKTDHNPFKATIDGQNIYGLGTTDVKLDFLCKLRALKEFSKSEFRKPFVFVGTYCEEVGMVGAQTLMESEMVNAKEAIIGEPSELQIVYANNGYLVVNFEVTFSEREKKFLDEHTQGAATTQEKIFRGKAAHSSTPHLGENALLKLVEYLSKLPQGIAIIEARGGVSVNTVPADAYVEIDAASVFEDSVSDRLIKLVKELQKLEREFLNFNSPEFSPSHPTLNIGVMKTRKDESVTISVSFRITPLISDQQIKVWIQRLTDFSGTIGVLCAPERMTSPALTPLGCDLIKGAVEISKKLGLPQKPITKASGTECSIYRAQGIDCFVFGPGVSIGNSHTPNEYNIISHLEKATQFYTEAVKRFCI